MEIGSAELERSEGDMKEGKEKKKRRPNRKAPENKFREHMSRQDKWLLRRMVRVYPMALVVGEVAEAVKKWVEGREVPPGEMTRKYERLVEELRNFEKELEVKGYGYNYR